MSRSADIRTITPTDEPSSRPDSDVPRLADLIVKAGCIYAMDERRATFRSLAVSDGRIVAVSEESDGLDALASPGTSVLDDSELTVLPAFFDVHEHLLDSARNLGRVPSCGQPRSSFGDFVLQTWFAAGKQCHSGSCCSPDNGPRGSLDK
jgi:hypothetical protein